jgi:hypothetical protein
LGDEPGEGVQVWDAVRLRRLKLILMSFGQYDMYFFCLRSRGRYLSIQVFR